MYFRVAHLVSHPVIDCNPQLAPHMCACHVHIPVVCSLCSVQHVICRIFIMCWWLPASACSVGALMLRIRPLWSLMCASVPLVLHAVVFYFVVLFAPEGIATQSRWQHGLINVTSQPLRTLQADQLHRHSAE